MFCFLVHLQTSSNDPSFCFGYSWHCSKIIELINDHKHESVFDVLDLGNGPLKSTAILSNGCVARINFPWLVCKI